MNRKRNREFWMGVVTALTLLHSTATMGRQLSVEQAKQLAAENNRTIKNARLDVNMAKKKVIETTAIGLPQVQLTANYQHIFKVPEFGFGTSGFSKEPLFSDKSQWPAGYAETNTNTPGGLNMYYYEGQKFPIMQQDNATFNLQVSQLIFSGEYLVGLQATKVYKLITEQALTKSSQEVGAMVESTYYMALVVGENLNIVQQNKLLMEQTLKEMSAIQKAGFMEDTEVDQLRVNLKTLENLEISLQGQQKNIQNQIKYQLGMELTEELTLTESLQDIIGRITPFDAENFNVKQNIDYQMVTNQVAAQKLSLKRELTGYLPTIAGFYQHQEKAKEVAFDFQPKDVIGATLTLPIFSSGSRLMKVKQARMSLEKAKNSQSQVEDGLALQYTNQRLAYQTAYNTFLTQKENSEISRRIFEKTRIKLKEGVSGSLDLTQVQSQYLSAVSNYYTSVFNLLNARVELSKMMGK